MKQETENMHYFEDIFKEIYLYIGEYGVESLLHKLNFLTVNEELYFESENIYHKLSVHLGSAIKKHGVEYVYLMLKTNKTTKPKFKIKDKTIENKLFEIVSDTYGTSPQSILNKFDRDGIRINAGGTIFKLFIDLLDYSINDVMEITKKPKSIISRHKKMICNLDHKHPLDKKTIVKYMECRTKLIKFLLDEYQEN